MGSETEGPCGAPGWNEASMTTGATLAFIAEDCGERGVLASSGNNVPDTGVTWLGRDLRTVWLGWAWGKALQWGKEWPKARWPDPAESEVGLQQLQGTLAAVDRKIWGGMALLRA